MKCTSAAETRDILRSPPDKFKYISQKNLRCTDGVTGEQLYGEGLLY